MINFYSKNKQKILNLSLKKIYNYFFLSDLKSDGYFAYIKNQVIEYISFNYPHSDKNKIEKIFNTMISEQGDYKDITSQLNNFFNPDFDNDIDFHYKYNENRIFFKFILYSINTKLIKNKYSNIYDFAFNELKEPLNILEIGGGLPHGFIYNFWKKNKIFFKEFNYIDADLLHAKFIRWYCDKNDINHDISLFLPSETPFIKNKNYNFVFAKDIFEHLKYPALLIDNLLKISNEKKNILLCLDLEHKGSKTVQHLNPNLPILKEKLIKNNFKVIKKFEEIHVWKKIDY